MNSKFDKSSIPIAPLAVGETVVYCGGPGSNRQYPATITAVHAIDTYREDGPGRLVRWPLVDVQYAMVGADGQAETLVARCVPVKTPGQNQHYFIKDDDHGMDAVTRTNPR